MAPPEAHGRTDAESSLTITDRFNKHWNRPSGAVGLDAPRAPAGPCRARSCSRSSRS